MRQGSRAGLAGAALTVAIAGCGGGARQDAHEHSASYKVQVVSASFPASQQLARPERMAIAVRNADRQTIPNVAVTVDGFNHTSPSPGQADPTLPTWIVDTGPSGGDTAYKSTWALGPLAPGETKNFTWSVTAIAPGQFTVRYRVAAGLNGKARAKLAGGGSAKGIFRVNVTGKPSASRVDPNSGGVIGGSAPPQSSGSGAAGTGGSGGRSSGGNAKRPPPGF